MPPDVHCHHRSQKWLWQERLSVLKSTFQPGGTGSPGTGEITFNLEHWDPTPPSFAKTTRARDPSDPWRAAIYRPAQAIDAEQYYQPCLGDFFHASSSGGAAGLPVRERAGKRCRDGSDAVARLLSPRSPAGPDRLTNAKDGLIVNQRHVGTRHDQAASSAIWESTWRSQPGRVRHKTRRPEPDPTGPARRSCTKRSTAGIDVSRSCPLATREGMPPPRPRPDEDAVCETAGAAPQCGTSTASSQNLGSVSPF